MSENRKDKKQQPNGFIELVEYLKEEIKKRKAEKLVKYAGITAVIIIAAIAFTIIFGKNNKNPDETEPGAVITVEDPSDQSTLYAEDLNPLEENAYPEIDELINTYFTALKEYDSDTINKIVDSEDEITVEQLQKTGEYIEDYKNITVYTKKGLLDDTYIVFVYYEIKFLNIDTLAPSLTKRYVCKDEQGSVYVYDGTLDGEADTYIQEMMESDDVVALRDDVNNRLQQAMESDQLLADFIQYLNGVSNPEQTEEETTAGAESTEEVTTAASNES